MEVDMSNKGITRREMMKLCIAGAGGMALGLNPIESYTSKSKMTDVNGRKINVLFINTDQQRFDALSCAGSPYVSTPNMDRLAREGVRFTHAYTAQPECVPARTSFHTGRTVFNSRCSINTKIEADDLNLGSGSFDQNLSRIGYGTEYHGRWHAATALTDCYANTVTTNFSKPYREYLRELRGETPKPGTNEEKSIISGWPYNPDISKSELEGTPHAQFNIQYGIYTLPTHHTFTGFTANQTIDAIKRMKNQPFSITSAYLSPHHPWYVPKPFADSISPDVMDLPATMHHDRQNTPYVNNGWQLDKVEIEHQKLFRARYFELIAEVDYHLGRVLRTLDQLGLADNTLIIFTADHGEMLGDHGLSQKFVPYQESVRVPLLMRLPGMIPAGRVIDQPVNTVDIFSTIFDYLGLPCPEQDGSSLRPLIEGKRNNRSEYTFSELGWAEPVAYTLFASHDWKYVWMHDPKSIDMLYDLNRDPEEINNLLGNNPSRGKYLSKAKEIRSEMLAWMESIGHPMRDKLYKSEIG